MIRSMTGYGSAEEILGGRDIRVEIKSVNHRYFEYSARVPRNCGFVEERMKRLLSGAISRGKVDVGVSIQTVESVDEAISINRSVVKNYVDALRSVRNEFDLADDLSLSSIAKLPDVFTVVKAETDEEALWKDIEAVAKKALAEMFLQTGGIVFDDAGMVQRGMIVRHLVLPGGAEDSKRILSYLFETYGNRIFLSIMNQYTPAAKNLPAELRRPLAQKDYDAVLDFAVRIGVEQAFIQEEGTADMEYIPAFDGTGV